MNAEQPIRAPMHIVVDRAGRLVEAEQGLRDLNARAGGGIGLPVALPPIAKLAWLAQRLGIVVTREVLVADSDEDIELSVRAEPEADGVRLVITGWRRRAAWQPEATERDRKVDFLRSSGGWVWETDSELRITFLSPGAGSRYGFDAGAALGQPLTRLFALCEDGDGAFPILAGLARSRGFVDQHATLRETGQAVRLSAAPRTDGNDRFAGFAGSARTDDLPKEAGSGTEPVQRRNLASMLAARLDQALRRPLDRIVSGAETISARREGPLRQDYADYADDIAVAGRHLIGLVDDLVDLQAIERPDFAVARDSIDLADVARRAAGLLGVRAAEAGIRIDKPKPEEAMPVTGEFRRALQVLVNLVGNAIRYSLPDGTVSIRIGRVSGYAAVIVSDEGKGIAIEDQARIFEKFERVDPREAGGSGLGLHIARRLARAMDGDVTVDSAPGHGARFIFTLPDPDRAGGG